MHIKGVIFDLDGVLCSTDRYHTAAWRRLAEELGIRFEEKTSDAVRGVSRMDSLDIVLGEHKNEYSPEQKTELADRKNSIYRGYLSTMTPSDVTPSVRFMLEKLKSCHIPMAIGSSSKNTVFILQKTELMGYFPVIVDGTQISKSKPDPEVFLLAAQKLGLRPDECCVLEDAHAGIEAARRGGFIRIAIGSTVRDDEAEYYLESADGLTEILMDN